MSSHSGRYCIPQTDRFFLISRLYLAVSEKPISVDSREEKKINAQNGVPIAKPYVV